MKTNVRYGNEPNKYNKAKPRKDIQDVYNICQITKQVCIPFVCVGKNIQETLEKTISKMIDGKCIIDGFVKPGSVKIITYSSGVLKGENIIFDVVFSCFICFPVAGMNMKCVARDITKAGIRAESADEMPSPFILFIARDHFYANPVFNSIKVGQIFTARVIAQRFELNDKYISIIAELTHNNKVKDATDEKEKEP